ncbi:HAMP domain-containing histidine kinase [Sphingomonas sanguinis]|uniref:histidine kinase n=1 Tax=Sphingomonas sanguinis TaxID=33051 RepID=A0ABU5LSI8_9SPHN|nr:HAMP domain-containing sensor histidine kinase [Sphingomonas sanguinis]MDZ7282900.1 HAMP domain-containing histidine kinase [Sphingomonas sanguinis]
MLGAVFVIGLVAMLGVVYVATARDLTARSDRILHASAQRLLQVPTDQLPDRVRYELRRDRAGFNYMSLIAADGTLVVGNVRLLRPLPPGQPVDVEDGARGPFRLIALRTREGETLLVGRDISLLRDLRLTILETLIVSGLLTLACVAAAAIGFSRAPLRRVQALQRASREIAAGDFSVRMPIAGRHDELDQFATTVNATVEEVGRVVAQVKGATDAIAHDLRTPLTRVRATLNALHHRPHDAVEVTAGIRQATADLDLVLERFAALLRISELEAGRRRAGFRRIDLGILVTQVAELYEPLAEDRDITLSVVARPWSVEGDDKLLFEALSNLLDNAIKFGRPGGRVAIALTEDARGRAIEVHDDGPGIAAEERDAVLRRFHRGQGVQDIAGSGLGLSVVVAILHLHGFRLELSDADPGLCVRIALPRSV